MAGPRALFKAHFCVSLTSYDRDLAIVLVAGDGHAFGAAGLAAIIPHADARGRGRRVDRWIDHRARAVDRDCRTRIVRNADVAARIVSVVPGGERVNDPGEKALMTAVVSLHEMREWLAHMDMGRRNRVLGKVPRHPRRQGARESTPVGAEGSGTGAPHEGRPMDDTRGPPASVETTEASSHATGKGRVGNQ